MPRLKYYFFNSCHSFPHFICSKKMSLKISFLFNQKYKYSILKDHFIRIDLQNFKLWVTEKNFKRSSLSIIVIIFQRSIQFQMFLFRKNAENYSAFKYYLN